MNKQTIECSKQIAKILKDIPSVTKAVIVGPATEDSFFFQENLILAVFSKNGVAASTVFGKIVRALHDHSIDGVDVYPMADPDFYNDVYAMLDDGVVIFER